LLGSEVAARSNPDGYTLYLDGDGPTPTEAVPKNERSSWD
jgi:hypothetical protein